MRLRTIGLISVLALGLLAGPLPAEAQQTGKVYRIGFLTWGGSVESFKPRLTAFRQALQKLGYVEGKNIVIDERYGEGRRERLPALAMELVRLKPDVIVTHGGSSARAADRAAKEVGRTIPLVFAVTANPLGTVASRSGASQFKALQAVAPTLGVTLLPVAFSKPGDLDRAFAVIERERPDALFVLGYSLVSAYRRQIVEFALKNHLPSIHTTHKWVVLGSLMSYGTNLLDLYRRSATYVDKILNGARPAELPVEQPTRFYLTLNLKTAKVLGIKFPKEVLFRADKVIK